MPTKNIQKDVRYLNKDFVSTRNALIDFAKVYFPEEYSDFSDASVGMMFIEMSSYVSDVLSLYSDTQLRESLLPSARNFKNVINIAQSFSYQPKVAGVSHTTLDVYQTIPATSFPFVPDWRYALKIKDLRGSSETNPDISFRIEDTVDFAESGSTPTEVTIYQTNTAGDEITYFLLKKSVPASSGIVTTKEFTVAIAQKYLKIILPDTDVIDILSVKDSDGNDWYEVPYLAQDMILESVNTSLVSDFSNYKTIVPYILRYKKVSKRYIKRVRDDGRTEMQFGAGTSAYADELIIPNPKTLGYTYFNKPLDPRNFLNTRTYGQIPSNTTLTVTYVRGSDEQANVPVGDIKNISNYEVSNDDTSINQGLLATVKASLAIVNSTPAVGSKGAESVEEVRNNALAFFAAQDRCVTREDYEVRILSMHPKYGSIAKVKIVQDDQLAGGSVGGGAPDNPNHGINRIPNPLALNAYCLGYNSLKNLTQLNTAIKHNLQYYLQQYRIATDAINIKDAYIINIGIEFEIIAYQNVINKREVVLACIEELKKYFNIDNWQIGQPIILSELYNLLDKIEGVRTVTNILITNKYDSTGATYSNNFYSIGSATIDGVVYTSLDPSCFEVKYPNKDIFGRAR